MRHKTCEECWRACWKANGKLWSYFPWKASIKSCPPTVSPRTVLPSLMCWQGAGKKVVGKTRGGHYPAGDKMAPEEELTVEEDGTDRPAETTKVFLVHIWHETNFKTDNTFYFEAKTNVTWKKTSQWVDEHINLKKRHFKNLHLDLSFFSDLSHLFPNESLHMIRHNNF